MNEEKTRQQFVRRLNLSFLGEIGSSELYGRQSQVTRDPELAGKLRAFIQDETRHAEKLAQMISQCGGETSRLGGATRVLFSVLGVVIGLLGVRTVLLFNRMLEQTGIDLYNAAAKFLPQSEARLRYQQDIAQMIADEQKHQAWFQQKTKAIRGYVRAGD